MTRQDFQVLADVMAEGFCLAEEKHGNSEIFYDECYTPLVQHLKAAYENFDPLTFSYKTAIGIGKIQNKELVEGTKISDLVTSRHA